MSITGTHDLRVAWYRPDARHVAWPVKTVGYRCQWPTDASTPKIVIASELGRRSAGSSVLLSSRYVNPTVYHQSNTAQPGYSPNYEHALVAASNLGNSAPALYALRTDLINRDTQSGQLPATQSYALLKYRDPLQATAIQMKVYRVLLTQDPEPIVTSSTPIAGDDQPGVRASCRGD